MSVEACVETLTVLVAMAWADGRLDEAEKAGVRGAADIFNLSKELRERIDLVLERPMSIEYVLVESLSPKERAFAYVAAAWMAGVDEDVDPKEEEMLDKLGAHLGLATTQKAELERFARDIEPPPDGRRRWSNELERLFKAIPPRLEGAPEDAEIEVVFE
jgi:uncharacterized membrane protein YebE (DUF533 family)